MSEVGPAGLFQSASISGSLERRASGSRRERSENAPSGAAVLPGTAGLQALAAPLLSITIPTYNRAPFLAELLEVLLPQVRDEPRAELVVSDNASADGTPELLAGFQERGLPLRHLRNAENVGSDGNFLQCLEAARGKYVWVLGDDDLLTPGAVGQLLSLLEQAEMPDELGRPRDFDLVYLSSFGFSGRYTEPSVKQVEDRLGRFAEVVTSGPYLLEKINALVGLISAVIINRDRLLALPHPPIEGLRDTNLIQAGWIFPLLHRRCRVLYVWQRVLAYRSFNSHGWGVCEVFGLRLHRIAAEYFRNEPALARALLNGTLRYWLSDKIFSIRTGEENEGMHSENVIRVLEPAFRGNWRYWVFCWTMARPPMWVVRVLRPLLTGVNRVARAGQALRRHVAGHGRYLRP